MKFKWESSLNFNEVVPMLHLDTTSLKIIYTFRNNSLLRFEDFFNPFGGAAYQNLTFTLSVFVCSQSG